MSNQAALSITHLGDFLSIQPEIEESQILSRVYSEIQACFNQFDDPAHGWEHIQRGYLNEFTSELAVGPHASSLKDAL